LSGLPVQVVDLVECVFYFIIESLERKFPVPGDLFLKVGSLTGQNNELVLYRLVFFVRLITGVEKSDVPFIQSRCELGRFLGRGLALLALMPLTLAW